MPIASPFRRTTILGAEGSLTLSAALVTGLTPAPAVAGGSFRALAAADGARLTLVAVNGPATNVPVDLGAPAAQASLDSLGTNQSFAAQPYPGDAAISAPGLIAGVTNGQLAPPDYPLYVSADYPIRPEQTVDHPGYRLQATAAERRVAASALSGSSSADGSAAATSAEARATSDGATVEGVASNVTTGLAAGPLTIGRISSTASVTRQADGAINRRSALDISGAKIGDTAVSITPSGITAGAAATPLPDSSPVVKMLSAAGVTLKYLAGSETENGLVAPALEVTWTRAVPGPVTPVTVIWTLGRAFARVDGGGGSGAAIPGSALEPEAADAPPTAAAPGSGVVADHGAPAAMPASPDAVVRPPFDAPRFTAVLGATSSSLQAISQPGVPGGAGASGADVAQARPVSTTAELASPAGALMPPAFDIRSSFGVLALAVFGGWVVSRRRKPAGRQSDN